MPQTVVPAASRPTSLLSSRAAKLGFVALIAVAVAATPVSNALAARGGEHVGNSGRDAGRATIRHQEHPQGHNGERAHGNGEPTATPTTSPAPHDSTEPTTPPSPKTPVAPVPSWWPWARALHGQLTLQTRDAGTEAVTLQRGQVSAVGDGSVTILSADGFSATWSLTSTTRVYFLHGHKAGVGAAGLAVGQTVGAWGSGDPSAPTARIIIVARAGSSPTPTSTPTPSSTPSPTAAPTESASPTPSAGSTA